MSEKMSEHKSSSSGQLRRINKPLMEKKRRARINSCLGQLKSLVLESMKKDPSRYSKLEKADILEMTVKHLRDVQRQHLSVAATIDPTVVTKFRNGYTECAKEVSRYLGNIDGISPDVHLRVLDHLNGSLHKINSQTRPVPMLPQAHHVSMQPISVQIPSASSVTSLPGAGRLLTPSPIQTVMTAEGTQIHGTFQLVPGPYPGGNGLTVFVPSPNATRPSSYSGSSPYSARSSPNSSLSDISPSSSPEPAPRPLTAAEKKQGVSTTYPFSVSSRYNAGHISAGRDINHNEIPEVKVDMDEVWRPW